MSFVSGEWSAAGLYGELTGLGRRPGKAILQGAAGSRRIALGLKTWTIGGVSRDRDCVVMKTAPERHENGDLDHVAAYA